jgi:hypothetical protein
MWSHPDPHTYNSASGFGYMKHNQARQKLSLVLEQADQTTANDDPMVLHSIKYSLTALYDVHVSDQTSWVEFQDEQHPRSVYTLWHSRRGDAQNRDMYKTSEENCPPTNNRANIEEPHHI